MTDDDWRGLLPHTIRRAEGAIYHYTSAAGLLGIVENNELWATEATGMNDMAEVRQGWEFIRQWVATQDPEDRITKIVLNACEPGSPESDSEGLFMCCASMRGDDANQWRLYGSHGRGYAVELDASVRLAPLARADERVKQGVGPLPTAMGEAAELLKLWDTVSTTAFVTPWLHVLYDQQEKTDTLDGLATISRARWQALSHHFAEREVDYDTSREFHNIVVGAFRQVAQLMKSEGFSGENEVRSVVTDPFGGAYRFRSTDIGIVRYVRLTSAPAGHSDISMAYRSELDLDMTTPLRSVRLGPLLDEDTSVAVIKALLNRNGHDGDKVTVSEVPLRP